MRRPLGAIESPGGGEWRMVFREEQKLKGWTFHEGMTSVPGPDMVQIEVDARLKAEIADDIEAQDRWVTRRQEIEDEINARKA